MPHTPIGVALSKSGTGFSRAALRWYGRQGPPVFVKALFRHALSTPRILPRFGFAVFVAIVPNSFERG